MNNKLVTIGKYKHTIGNEGYFVKNKKLTFDEIKKKVESFVVAKKNTLHLCLCDCDITGMHGENRSKITNGMCFSKREQKKNNNESCKMFPGCSPIGIFFKGNEFSVCTRNNIFKYYNSKCKKTGGTIKVKSYSDECKSFYIDVNNDEMYSTFMITGEFDGYDRDGTTYIRFRMGFMYSNGSFYELNETDVDIQYRTYEGIIPPFDKFDIESYHDIKYAVQCMLVCDVTHQRIYESNHSCDNTLMKDTKNECFSSTEMKDTKNECFLSTDMDYIRVEYLSKVSLENLMLVDCNGKKIDKTGIIYARHIRLALIDESSGYMCFPMVKNTKFMDIKIKFSHNNC